MSDAIGSLLKWYAACVCMSEEAAGHFDYNSKQHECVADCLICSRYRKIYCINSPLTVAQLYIIYLFAFIHVVV